MEGRKKEGRECEIERGREVGQRDRGRRILAVNVFVKYEV